MKYYQHLQEHQGCRIAKLGRYHIRNVLLWVYCFVFPIHCQPLATYIQTINQQTFTDDTRKQSISSNLCKNWNDSCSWKKINLLINISFCTIKNNSIYGNNNAMPSSHMIKITIMASVAQLFTAWCYASAVYAVVACLCVTFQYCIKQLNLGSCKQCHTIAQRLYYSDAKGKFEWHHPKWECQMQVE